ncbi:MAG: phosphatase PAP2 family protein [Candidatus Hodarchaeota archaeon]
MQNINIQNKKRRSERILHFFQDTDRLGYKIFHRFYPFFQNPKNIAVGLLVISAPAIYGLFPKPLDEKIRNGEHHVTKWSPWATDLLREIIGVGKDHWFSIFSTWYYTWLFVCINIGSGIYILMLNKKRREPWIYLLCFTSLFIIDTILYYIFPVAPPVRYLDGYNIRAEILPHSETMISIDYNALPSAHIWILAIPWCITIAERHWKLTAWYSFHMVLMTIVVVYLGDHYLIDCIVALILTVIVFVTLVKIYDWRNGYHTVGITPSPIGMETRSDK